MTPNTPPEKFLKETLGHQWNAVQYDEHTFGRLGEKVSVEPVASDHANGYQSVLLSAEMATQICDRLAELGIVNPRDFTRVGVGNSGVIETRRVSEPSRSDGDASLRLNPLHAADKKPFAHTTYEATDDTEAVTLIFKREAIDGLMKNAALLDATINGPIITTTGMEEFAAAHHPNAVRNQPFGFMRTRSDNRLTETAFAYLRSISQDVAPEAVWHKPTSEYDVKAQFSLRGADEKAVRIIQAKLEQHGILTRINHDVLEVPTFTLHHALETIEKDMVSAQQPQQR